ncbi:hypothetical protein KQI68_06865 [Peptoniphilus sp. MSJ-1]|uniref:Uncharacterized protein n=1 Tax=Peptoniphilus ovalis TaxID=2841503 RepID=A0ABS6FHB1_9FIRM|nr:hypothetical protein [Peptoniphilus ovalis]MBU5669560.1 hypothetical protein [Peptoniphilus ovalis]
MEDTLIPYSPLADKEVDHYEYKYLYGSLDSNYPIVKLDREMEKEDLQGHSTESKKQLIEKPIDISRGLLYKEKLTEEEIESYNLILLARISEPVYVE